MKQELTEFEKKELNIKKGLLIRLINQLKTPPESLANKSKEDKNLGNLGDNLAAEVENFIQPNNENYQQLESIHLINILLNLCHHANRAFLKPSPEVTNLQAQSNLCILASAAARISQYPSLELRQIASIAMVFAETAAFNYGFTLIEPEEAIDNKSTQIKHLSEFFAHTAMTNFTQGIAGMIKIAGAFMGRTPANLKARSASFAISPEQITPSTSSDNQNTPPLA